MENPRHGVFGTELGCAYYHERTRIRAALPHSNAIPPPQWMQEQKSNILLYHIEQDGYPSIQYLAEAGLIGKIGLNSAGKHQHGA